jgi:hypothetical protein
MDPINVHRNVKCNLIYVRIQENVTYAIPERHNNCEVKENAGKLLTGQ